jgi:hypothetical protein
MSRCARTVTQPLCAIPSRRFGAAGIATTNAAVFLTGSVITGAGFGLAFLGAIRAISAVAAPVNRGGTLAVLYIVSYLAFSIPVIIAGVAETHYSAHNVALVFSAAVGLLSAIGLGASFRRSAHAPAYCDAAHDHA